MKGCTPFIKSHTHFSTFEPTTKKYGEDLIFRELFLIDISVNRLKSQLSIDI